VRANIGSQTAPVESDADLLDRFLTRRDESAFELLVWRHERLVRGVCRRLLRAEQDVEDVCQATFLTLACKAAAIGRRQAVSAWLYMVAYRIALRAKADAVRRGRHEKAAAEARAQQSDEPTRQVVRADLRAVIEEEISRLPEKYRTLVILCYMEGKNNEEAALVLGRPTGTVVTWLARARKQLRVRLARRGVEVTASTLATALALSEVASAAPAFVQTTVVAARFDAGDPSAAGTVSARVVSLTKGALHTMLLNRLKSIGAVVLALCLIGAGSGMFVYRALAAEAVAPLPVAPRPENAMAAQPAQAIDDPPAGRAEAAPQQNKENQKPARQKLEEVVTKSFKTGKTPSLELELFNGRIEVVTDADGAVNARVTKQSQADTRAEAEEALKNIEVAMTQEQDTVRISARRLEQKNWQRQEGAWAEVHVPPGAVLNMRTSNGPIKLTGGSGRVTVHTSNGAITVKDSKGPLKLDTSNGDISVTGAVGALDLKTTNGTIDLQAEKALVKAHTSNGAIRFSGSLSEGEHALTTSNGTIALTLSANAQFRIEARTSHGRIVSDFPSDSKEPAERGRLNTTVGEKPAATVKLHTSNGSIEIRKK
jgi:RNA polymerase sigma factor (sigma-70 family)